MKKSTRSLPSYAPSVKPWRTRRDEQLRAEAEAVANDPDDVAEARAVLTAMEALRAW
jgi:hypothetical protein